MNKKPFGLVGLSGLGPNTVIEDLIAWLGLEGFRVSIVKHSHHSFDLDKPGKDSFRMREAGACEVALVGGQRWALMQEYRDLPEPTLQEIIDRLQACDLVLVEGYRSADIPLVEFFCPSSGRSPLWMTNSAIVAIATDEHIDSPLPILRMTEIDQLGEFILRYLSLSKPPESHKASLGAR